MTTPQEVREVAAYIRGRMMRFDTSYLCRPQLEKEQAMLEELARLKEVRDEDVERPMIASQELRVAAASLTGWPTPSKLAVAAAMLNEFARLKEFSGMGIYDAVNAYNEATGQEWREHRIKGVRAAIVAYLGGEE